jgi:pantoate--beta-alanine ligase
MRTVSTLSELGAARALLSAPLGLVPTMGYLHDGHLSLVRRARSECASVVASIFVNPTQFGPEEDLATYPRDLPRDLDLLEREGVDLVWIPTPEVMYPPGFQTWVTVEELTKPLEGALRRGHFRGVATVVTKLFAAVQPQRAYFGQKDAQQAIVIGRMARDLSFPIDVVVCRTVREPDGLAMSSRNAYLNGPERQAAAVLYRALQAAKAEFDAGERDAERLRLCLAEVIGREPLARLQYASCAHPDTLEELDEIGDGALLSLAVLVGRTRLIDNVLVGRAEGLAAQV